MGADIKFIKAQQLFAAKVKLDRQIGGVSPWIVIEDIKSVEKREKKEEKEY